MRATPSPSIRSRPETARAVKCTLLGVGAMNSPRFAPAGLLLEHAGIRVMFDGGPGASPKGRLAAWLVTDDRAELIHELRGLAAGHGLAPAVDGYIDKGLEISALPVIHTSHPTVGYRIDVDGHRVVWAPEFLAFPAWAAGADLMFADAAGWSRPIYFTRGAGGHAAALDVSREAAAHGVARLVLAHIGRPTIRAIDHGLTPPFGEFGTDGAVYRL